MLFAVRNLRAERVNLLMNDFAAGLPSPLAFLGMAASVAPALGASRWSAKVLPIMHDVQLYQGRTKPEMSLNTRATPHSFKTIEIAEDLVGSARVSLLLEIDGGSNANRIADVLLGKRLAGGAIVNESIDVRVVPVDGTAFTQIARGYALIPPQIPELAVVASGRPGELERFAETLFPTDGEPRPGWFVPVAVGHRLLEDPNTAPRRQNTRDPNIALVASRATFGAPGLLASYFWSSRAEDRNGCERLMWRWHSEGEYVVGHEFYHPKSQEQIEQEQLNGDEKKDR